MTSNIDPNNIDPTFPQPSQNNDSQGFRDNFAAIQLNFERAEEEISNIQSILIGATGPVIAAHTNLTGPLTTIVTGFKKR